MMWTMPLSVWLLVVAVHLSVQDMVTLAPGETEEIAPSQKIQKPSIKPIIRSFQVHSNISFRYATTTVSSRVVNPSNYSGEAAFTVTIPESAFISQFLMEVKGKVYKAYVKEKEAAKAVYNQAVEAGQFAGHVALDARDSHQFTVSINVEAQGKVTFNLTYEQLLSRTLGSYNNIININPQQIVDDMSVVVNIEEPTAITNLVVPEVKMSNEAEPEDTVKQNELAKIEEISPNHKRVTWAPTPEQQKILNSTGISGQFIVKYDVDRKENPQQILVDEGYFVHFFAPEDLPKLKKHVVFVLDYSGSMAGRKLDQLKDAMNKILSDLDSKDYFSIVIFQSYVEAWSPKKKYTTGLEHAGYWDRDRVQEFANTTLDHEFVVQATPTNIDLARTYLQSYSDLGSTNIMGGLRTGLKLVKIGSAEWQNDSDPPQPVVVFLTDGLPNVEEYNTDAIINKTKQINTKECPVFSLAFGYGADFNFLRKLSLSNNGFARNIYEAADASEQLKNFYRTIASPLMSNVTFNYLPGQVDNSTNTKRDFPVFFKGSELVVAGKINKDSIKDKETIGELSALTASGHRLFPIVIDVILTPKKRSAGHLEKAWAYLTIQQLLDKADALDNSEEKNQTQKRALDLALQYSFVTPLTSLVVVKPNETESAVDTTKVRPGDDGPMFAASGIGGYGASGFGGPVIQQLPLAFPASPLIASGFAGAAASSAQSSGMRLLLNPRRAYTASENRRLISSAPFMRRRLSPLSKVSVSASRLPLPPPPPPAPPSTTFAYTTEAASAVQKVSLNDVKWLQQFLIGSQNSSDVIVSVEGHNYHLALNETDQSFGTCQVNSKSGECHHFQHCPLSIFTADVSDFVPYQCPIPGDFLGVCCPADIS